jgi:hypothetical protein
MATLAQALQTGFYDGKRRRAGEVFSVKDGAAASWFEILSSDVAKPESSKKARKPKAESTQEVETVEAAEPEVAVEVVEKTLSEAVADGDIASTFEV